jgi:hypothetical protein
LRARHPEERSDERDSAQPGDVAIPSRSDTASEEGYSLPRVLRRDARRHPVRHPHRVAAARTAGSRSPSSGRLLAAQAQPALPAQVLPGSFPFLSGVAVPVLRARHALRSPAYSGEK